MTLKEALEILDKDHAAGISDEDCAWFLIRDYFGDRCPNCLSRIDDPKRYCNRCKPY
jgi:hypothetical protein